MKRAFAAEQTNANLQETYYNAFLEKLASQLMMHALAGRKGSREEIEELRRLLDEYERRRR